MSNPYSPCEDLIGRIAAIPEIKPEPDLIRKMTDKPPEHDVGEGRPFKK